MVRLPFAVLLSWCLCVGAWAEEPVYFADPNLRAAVEKSLHIPEPTPTDMLDLTQLMGIMSDIADLTGLEYATNLERLILHGNRIRDLSPLSGLTHLQELYININQISDLSPLSGLTNLRRLILHDNWVSDLSPLADLTGLEFLDFRDNVVDDLSPLVGMANLYYVEAFNNRISDLSPLLAVTGWRRLDLRRNPLNDQAYAGHLQAIPDRNPEIALSYSANSRGPAGVTASDGTLPDRVRLTWEGVCNGPQYTSYYQVSRARSAEGAQTPISGWQTSLSFDDVTAEPGTIHTYWVQAGNSLEGGVPGDYSRPEMGWLPGPAVLTVSSGRGGMVTSPGEGTHAAQAGQIVALQAEPVDANLYCFAVWTGTAAEAGLVADTRSASTTLTMPAARCTLQANFLSRLDVLYVDDDAPDDPGPGTAAVGDPRENGTRAHPFDTIQEGIDAAPAGATVVVRAGTYYGCVEFRGRSIKVTGLDPDGTPPPKPFPVIDANYGGTAVTFARGEDANCVLTGFVITRGEGADAGGIRCVDSSPTITHCLIVGNRASVMDRAAVYGKGSHARFVNCTVVNRDVGPRWPGIYLSNSKVEFVNSIVSYDVPRATIPLIWNANRDRPWMSYTCLSEDDPGSGNLRADPLFVQPGWWGDPDNASTEIGPHARRAVWIAGDYHLKSQAGRWDPQAQAWVRDDVTSPCIDAGDPNRPAGAEPEPNGRRINMGAYGGTAEASKSP